MSDLSPGGAGSPSFESDFRDLRDARDLSLGDLHQETRVPLDVLRRFESGHLLSDSSFSDVYLRAFVKEYARALGIPQSRALSAFDAHRKGRYDGQLRDGYTPPEPPVLSSPAATEAATPPSASVDKETETEAPRMAPPPTAAPAVEALRSGGTAVPAAPAAPKVDAPRVTRPMVPTAKRSFDKNLGVLGGLAAVLIGLVALAIWFLVIRDPSPEAETAVVAEETDSGMADEAEEASAAPAGPRLQTPLTVRVLAEGDGLQAFRVTVDDSERIPIWVEPGDSREFVADSVVVLWGEGTTDAPAFNYDETTVELQGLQWRPANGRTVRITPENGQALLDSLATAGASATLPPQPAR
ncbi:MAG: helix-turn-helix transcriptional regulator, partial [Bacteroidota bacterium]